ncbi:MAG: ABC transporter permease [Planctomycetaceae bacterium]
MAGAPSAPRPAEAPAQPLRGEAEGVTAWFWGATCIAAVLALWFVATAGEAEYRLVSPAILPSPGETFRAIPGMIATQKPVANTLGTLGRVVLGFGLAALVGVPLGIVAACFPPVRAFLAPLTIFGRNVPVAALMPLLFQAFGTGEFFKVMFLFVACVAFVVTDTTAALLEVPERYVDTARTLGASRLQIILKVLVPLAAPAIFNSLRLLFGIAFGYVMLVETFRGSDTAGLGGLVNIAQRLAQREVIWIVILIIPFVAYAIDRALWWLQCDLFPHRYGGRGLLPRLCRRMLHGSTAAAEAPA